MKIRKSRWFYFVLFIILLNKNLVINTMDNVNGFFMNKDNVSDSDYLTLTQENKYLRDELNELSNLNDYPLYKTSLSHVLYRVNYDNSFIFISGGENKNYKINYPIINNDGVVGLIDEVYKDYSKVKVLTNSKNLAITINDGYGTIDEYKDGLFIIKDLSNYDNIHLNDIVYTSDLGTINNKLIVGSVYKIDKDNYNTVIYVKSNVDFYKINYIYVVGDV